MQEKEDDLTESFESRTLPYVIGALIVLFVVLDLYFYLGKAKRSRTD